MKMKMKDKPAKAKMDAKAMKKAGGSTGSAQGPSMKGMIPGKKGKC